MTRTWISIANRLSTRQQLNRIGVMNPLPKAKSSLVCMRSFINSLILIFLLGPDLPTSYIKTIYHDRTGLPVEYVDLDAPEQLPPKPVMPPLEDFAPFPSYEDFTFAEVMIKMGASNSTINLFLQHLHKGIWCEKGSSKLRFRDAAQLRSCVDEAAKVYQGVRALHLQSQTNGLSV
jgi:hypothetical protein